MVDENMIINYLIQCEYFNEYKLNSNVEMVISDLINKIKHAYKRIHKLNNLKINKFGNEFVFERRIQHTSMNLSKQISLKIIVMV